MWKGNPQTDGRSGWWIRSWTLPERQKDQLLAPVVRGRKGTHVKLLDQARRSGYVRVQIDGNLYELSEEIKLDKNIKHNIEIVVDRLIVKPGIEKRLSGSIETVLDLADGLLVVDTMDGKLLNFSQSFSCPDCGISIDEIEPRSFSFNNPFGACPQCLGLGYKMEFDIDLMIPDKKRSINEGAIAVLGWQSCTTQGSFSRAILGCSGQGNMSFLWIRLSVSIRRRSRISSSTVPAVIL